MTGFLASEIALAIWLIPSGLPAGLKILVGPGI
jgi:hypothetical protein